MVMSHPPLVSDSGEGSSRLWGIAHSDRYPQPLNYIRTRCPSPSPRSPALQHPPSVIAESKQSGDGTLAIVLEGSPLHRITRPTQRLQVVKSLLAPLIDRDHMVPL